MSVTYHWKTDNAHQSVDVLELNHGGEWTFAEMNEAVSAAMTTCTDKNFIAVCIFPDEKYFPPDAVLGAPTLVRSTKLKKMKGLICVRHPMQGIYDMHSDMLESVMKVFRFPFIFAPDQASADGELEKLLSKIAP